MRYHSTRNEQVMATGAEAILQGMAPDGGLYVPETFPQVDFRTWSGLSFADMAERVFALYFDDLGEKALHEAAAQAYGKRFDHPLGTPVDMVNDHCAFLDLWHGPTLAFKDVALSVLPYLMRAAQKQLGVEEHILVLTATSGDTGKAAMEGFSGISGVSVRVFYPADGVSDAQRLQMLTYEADNVRAIGVEGNFDDCQSSVKRMFADPDLQEILHKKGIRLSSANSINIGRLIPQITYYVSAYLQLVEAQKMDYGEALDVVVPTGNFGDFLAGDYARRMGLPLGKMTVASNANHVLSDFGATGTYDSNRPLYVTTSPSMDILVSSNLERYLYHETQSTERVSKLMRQWKEEGHFTLREPLRAQWGWASEKECAETIASVYQKTGKVIDPHTAVSAFVAGRAMADSTEGITLILSTASPFKFPETVLSALHQEVPETLEEQWNALGRFAGLAVPQVLQAMVKQPPHRELRVSVAEMDQIVREGIKGGE